MKTLILATASVLFPLIAMAQAAPPPVIDMTVILKDDGGKAIPDVLDQKPDDPTCARCAPLTMGHAIAHALYYNYPDEKAVDAEQKYARAWLAKRIEDSTAAELSSTDVTVIKRLLGKMYGDVLPGMLASQVLLDVFPVIDPNSKPQELK